MDTHGAFVAAHAAAAAAALICGLCAFRVPRFAGPHAITTVAMAVLLVPALWFGDAEGVTLVVFLGLLALAAVMSVRAVHAWRRRPGTDERPGGTYLAALGFNAISLVTGLVAVSVFRLDWSPPALIPTAVAAIVLPTVAGRLLLAREVRIAGG